MEYNSEEWEGIVSIVMIAQFEVRPEKLAECEETIRKFVEHIHRKESGTLLFTSLQESEEPTRFLHYFIFRDEKMREIHSYSEEANKFTAALYPNLLCTRKIFGIENVHHNHMGA